MPLIFLTQTQTQLIKKNQYEYPFWVIRNSLDFVPSLKWVLLTKLWLIRVVTGRLSLTWENLSFWSDCDFFYFSPLWFWSDCDLIKFSQLWFWSDCDLLDFSPLWFWSDCDLIEFSQLWFWSDCDLLDFSPLWFWSTDCDDETVTSTLISSPSRAVMSVSQNIGVLLASRHLQQPEINLSYNANVTVDWRYKTCLSWQTNCEPVCHF